MGRVYEWFYRGKRNDPECKYMIRTQLPLSMENAGNTLYHFSAIRLATIHIPTTYSVNETFETSPLINCWWSAKDATHGGNLDHPAKLQVLTFNTPNPTSRSISESKLAKI